MAMTKKDYEAIASVIKHEVEVAKDLDSIGRTHRIGVCRVIATRVADYAMDRSVRFQRGKFLAACGVD